MTALVLALFLAGIGSLALVLYAMALDTDRRRR